MESGTPKAAGIKVLLQELDLLKDQKIKIAKRENEIGQKLNSYRAQIKQENEHLIGKRARATSPDGKTAQVVCTFVKVNTEFDAVPLFSDLGGKKFDAVTFEWE